MQSRLQSKKHYPYIILSKIKRNQFSEYIRLYMCLIIQHQNMWGKHWETHEFTVKSWRIQLLSISDWQIQSREESATIGQLNLIDFHRIFHQTTRGYTFFSNSHGAFTQTDRTFSNKRHFNKLEIIGIIQNMLSGNNRIKLKINNKKIAGKSPKHLEIK